MTVDNPVQYEVELVERLWSQGWAAFRTAAAGPGAVANADVIAIRDGTTFVGNVVVLESGTSTKKVRDENKDLKKIKRRADAAGFGKSSEIKIGHAVKKEYEDEWYYGHIDSGKIRATRIGNTLNSVLK